MFQFYRGILTLCASSRLLRWHTKLTPEVEDEGFFFHLPITWLRQDLVLSLHREVTIKGFGGLFASRFGRFAGTGFGFGNGQTWDYGWKLDQITVKMVARETPCWTFG